MITEILSLTPQVGILELIMIAIRVIVLIFIVKWVRERITGSTAATLITIVLSYFILFHWASFWIPIVLLLIVLPHGPLNIMFDLALGGGGASEGSIKKKKASQKKRRMTAQKKRRVA